MSDLEPIARLERDTGSSWRAIRAAAANAAERRARLETQIAQSGLVPPDCTFVVFGSLSRNEVTAGSDLDWTLLVDGACVSEHLQAAQAIARLLSEGYKAPGATALFGTLAFSHELVHLIGGDADTNRNTTRRILLLLESRALGPHGGIRERVLRVILERYLQEDLGYHSRQDWQIRAPRFLLNDIVRFWRTMAVDYAAKRRDRGGVGWAIRNFKLRLSRKLIFAAGLAMCMTCELRAPVALTSTRFTSAKHFFGAFETYLMQFCDRTPLEVLAAFVADFGATDAGVTIFTAYDQFLALLADPEKRHRLERLGGNEADDPVFVETRTIGAAFQDGLSKLFFASDAALTAATQRYGVF